MATTSTQQYWIRTDGADTNGGGFDPAGGAGVNYSDQAAAQATWAHLTLAAGTLTDADAGGLFTSNMRYNLVNVPGQGYYLITAFTSSNVVTVTACTGATTSFTTQPGKLGGALRQMVALNNGGGVSAPGTTSPLVPGNIVNYRASGSGSVGSPDYTCSSYVRFPDGDTTNGRVTWIAYNGTPYIDGAGLVLYGLSYHRFIGGYLYLSGGTFFGLGIVGLGGYCIFENMTFDAQNKSGAYVCAGTSATVFVNCILVGGGSSTNDGVSVDDGGYSIKNCRISGWGGYGVKESIGGAGVQISNCEIYSNVAGGVYFQTSTIASNCVDGCTIDNNSGPGIEIKDTVSVARSRILNNNITNNGTYGIKVDAGTAAQNDATIIFCDYNNVWNNSSGGYSGISAGAHDLNVNPSYT